jgi:hypothetical protein
MFSAPLHFRSPLRERNEYKYGYKSNYLRSGEVRLFYLWVNEEMNNDSFLGFLFFVLIAEMGDKTQLVALAYATRYTTGKVMAGVFWATLPVSR